MSRLTFPTACHPQGLRDELLAAGIPVALVMPEPANAARTIVDVPDGDEDRTAAVVAAHVPTVYTAQEDAARSAYQQAIDYLRTYRDLPSPTQQQTVNATRALIDVAKTQHQQLRDNAG